LGSFRWNKHFNLIGKHAILSPSRVSWQNYDEEKLVAFFNSYMAKDLGTRLHAWAAETIALGRKQPRNKDTINMYINDAIGFKMETEKPLYYSDNFFGTADAISFRNNELRIHDLKTGVTPAHMEQLFAYAALFCLEYKYKPSQLKFETRLYQNNEVIVDNPDEYVISPLMEKIIAFDKLLNRINGVD
jgi:hypothetical protein